MNFLRTIPRKVMMSLGVLALGLVLWGVQVPLLGGAREDADTNATRLRSEIDQTRKDLAQAGADMKYLEEHQEQFESLLKSDRLVPHTRRAAVAELQKIAVQNGITGLEYIFNAAPATSANAAQSQPTSGAYRVSVEQIELKVSAPTDGAIYRFLEDIKDSFPGSAVAQIVQLERPPTLTPAMMTALSKGEDAKIVTGDISVLWRTAEAEEQKEGQPGGKRK